MNKYSKEPIICSYSEPDTSVHDFPSPFFKIYFNVIFQSTPIMFQAMSFLQVSRTTPPPSPSHRLRFEHLVTTVEELKSALRIIYTVIIYLPALPFSWVQYTSQPWRW